MITDDDKADVCNYIKKAIDCQLDWDIIYDSLKHDRHLRKEVIQWAKENVIFNVTSYK